MEKPVRKIEDVQNDYQRLCVQLGHVEYQIDTLIKDSKLLKEQLRELNIEASKLAKVTSEAPKVE